MSVRTLLVDDERLARLVLRELLSEHPEVDIVAEANSLDSAVQAIQEHDPDLIFLDVQMPGGQGTQLFERLELRARVIFVTAYDHYAVRAFELNALDYLLKPVEPERLAQALQRAQPPAQERAPEQGLVQEELLCLPHRSGMRFFRVRDILQLSAEDDYCSLRLSDGTRLLSNTALRDWEAKLPPDFLRVHRSHLVHADHIQRVAAHGSSYLVHLSDGETVPMSRRQASKLLSQGRLKI